MFTDRFVKVPGKVFNKRNSELTGKEVLYECEIRILPMEVFEYYETLDDENIMCTQIYLKSGESFMVYLLIEEFEKLLNQHQK